MKLITLGVYLERTILRPTKHLRSLSLRRPDPRPETCDTVSLLEGGEREAFLDLTKAMLDWHPDARKRQANLRGILFFNQSRQEPGFRVRLLAE